MDKYFYERQIPILLAADELLRLRNDKEKNKLVNSIIESIVYDENLSTKDKKKLITLVDYNRENILREGFFRDITQTISKYNTTMDNIATTSKSIKRLAGVTLALLNINHIDLGCMVNVRIYMETS